MDYQNFQTEREMWREIAAALERHIDGDHNLTGMQGLCISIERAWIAGKISDAIYDEMRSQLHNALKIKGKSLNTLCWPLTVLGAKHRLQFIREHFLPAGCPQTCEVSVLTFEPHHKPAVNP